MVITCIPLWPLLRIKAVQKQMEVLSSISMLLMLACISSECFMSIQDETFIRRNSLIQENSCSYIKDETKSTVHA